MVIGQRNHAGAELDALGALAGSRQKHLGRGDHFPTRGVMLAAPELVIAERIELLDEVEVTAELQHRMLADRMMRGEESSEFEASRFKRRHFKRRHGRVSPDSLVCCWTANYGVGQLNAIGPPGT